MSFNDFAIPRHSLTDTPTPPPSQDNGYCIPKFEDYLPEGRFCYKIFSFYDEYGDIEMNMWSKAQLSCMIHGGDLASIHASEETTAIMRHWVTSATEMWIGLMTESMKQKTHTWIQG